jgi:tRNA(Ile)-lysidine synthetase-like protein
MTLQQLLSPTRAAVEKYHMIEEGDKIAVGLSGGKDSVALLTILAGLQRFYPKKFELVAITVDMGFAETSEEEKKAIAAHCEGLGVPYIVEKTDIGAILFEHRKEKNPCSLCSKMRRGALNTAAIKEGCNKLALGHHADDMMQTFLLSLFYEGRLSTFSPVSYMSKSDVTLIRPMIWIREKDLISFAKTLPVLHNPCPANKETKREDMKNFLSEIKKQIPFAEERVLTALIHPERYNLFDKFEAEANDLHEKVMQKEQSQN